jgi:hypothetical protein
MLVRHLLKKEIGKFQNLVKFSYKKNHVLATSKKLINFYYNFYDSQKLYLIGLFDKKQLMSVIGLMPYKNWDKKLKDTYHIAFWVKKNKLINSLSLLKFIFNKKNPKFLATSGINTKTSGKVFECFGKIKIFNNYFIKNDQLKSKISKYLKNKLNNFYKKKKLEMICMPRVSTLPTYFHQPKKSLEYFTNKYFKNPFYSYFTMQFFNKKKLTFFFICRIIKVKKFNVKIIRIIDFYGTIKKNYTIYNLVQEYLKKNKYEYIDFPSIGIDKELVNIGFTKNKNNFLPDFFEPYLNKKINRNYCILKNSYKGKIVMVKGDGDGDRPNLL